MCSPCELYFVVDWIILLIIYLFFSLLLLCFFGEVRGAGKTVHSSIYEKQVNVGEKKGSNIVRIKENESYCAMVTSSNRGNKYKYSGTSL